MKRRDEISGELLVLRCRQGDTAAFDDLVARWQDPLWRYAYTVTGDADAAWDVAQETWVAVIKGLTRLTDMEAFPQWLMRTAHNKAVNWVRKQTRTRRLKEEFSRENDRRSLSTSVPGRIERLRELLQSLPADGRALIALHYNQGFSYAEIAEIAGVPESTVKSRLFETRKALRERFEDKHDG